MLVLEHNSLTALPAGVFDKLTALTFLDLGDNSLTALPAAVFDELTALTILYLASNSLTALPDDVFDELTALTILGLGGNSLLTALPAGVFDELTALDALFLTGNPLTALPAGVFDELTALTELYLNNNSLAELPDDVFQELTALASLVLSGNPGAPFSPTAVALPDDGTVPAAGGTVMLDGSGSGGAWGTNVTYAWALTTPTSGVTVTFDSVSIAEPTVTIPPVTAGTDLVFTLTVTGRGGSNGIFTATDTAAVTTTTTTTTNAAPTVANVIPDQTATAGTGFSYQFPANTFNDTDTGDTLSYAATKADDMTLPTWLAFTAGTRTFAGTPALADTGTVSVKVTASDGNGGSVSDKFDITVRDLGICARTEAVRDALLASIAGVTDCALVTDTHLAAITGTLSLNAKSITVLAAGDFDGLTALTTLDLTSNSLTALPAGVFDGLTALTTLNLNDNFLTALPAGVFDELTALTYLDLDGNDLTALPAGVFDELTALRLLDLQFNDLTALPAGVFDELTALTYLDLRRNSLTALPAGVFDELTALTYLDLGVNSLTALPAGVFDKLTALGKLYLGENSLTALPDDVFDELTALTHLGLDVNSLTALLDDVFDELTALTYLDLNTNPLTALPAGVFDELTALEALYLFDNSLAELPDDVFEPLTSLSVLLLSGNPGAPFSPTAVALPDDGTVPAAGGTVMLDGSGSGGAWGTNVTYAWALRTPATGVTVTFDNDAIAKPTVTIPQVTAGTDLVFTLTVTGRGGSDGISTSTDTAKVTVNTVPGAPTGLTATASGTTTINLSWTAPASTGGSAITGYKIEVSPNGTSNWTDQVANTNSATTTYAHSGLAGGTTRHYRVSAINANGAGLPSNTDDATTAATVPGAPTSLTATASGSTTINLSWTAPASTGGSAITGYKIEVSPNGTSNWTDQVANTASTTTTYEHTGLAGGDTRHYRVSAINSVGTGLPSNVDDATTGTTEPGAPTGLTATASGTTTINLSWTAPASTGGSAITGYKIEVSPNGTSNWTDQVANTNSATTTYAHSGLAGGTTRHYRVSAINTNGTGLPSNTDDATTAATVPGAPTSLTATASGSTTINLSWTAPASTGGSAITGYRIEVSPNGTSNWTDQVANTASTTTTYEHTGLAGGDTRHYRVSAINSVGTGLPSNVDATTTGTTEPGAPTGLTATASGTTTINLSWTAPASTGGSAITGYKIEVSPNGTSNWTDQVANTNSTTTTYEHTGLAGGDTRHYRVSAINTNGAGLPSNVDDATTGTATSTSPGRPRNLDAAASGGAVTLSWQAPANSGGSAIVRYEVRHAEGTSVPANTAWQSAGLNLSHTISGLTNGQVYTFQVHAVNSSTPGTGPPAEVQATPMLAVGPPRVSIRPPWRLIVAEDVGNAVLTVSLDRPAASALSVPWQTQDHTAESPDDFTASEGAVTFRAGETRKTISVRIVDDAVREDPVHDVHEIFFVGLSWGPGYTLAQTPTADSSVALVEIVDNDGVGSMVGSMDTTDDALALVDDLTREVAAAVLLGEQTLSEARLAALDRLGNRNGRYDLGDLLSWIARCRRGEARCGSTSTDSGPAAAAMPAAAAAGSRSIPRRPRRRDSGRRGRCRGRSSIGGIRHRARVAGYALAILLAAMTWSCTEGSVGPVAAKPDPGFLTVEWSGPATNRDVGVLLELEGPTIDAVRAPGLELYESSAPGPHRIVVAGVLRPGALVQFRVPDRNQFALYRVRVLQVTGEDYGLRDVGEYQAVIKLH